MAGGSGGGGGMWQAKRIGRFGRESRGRDGARAANIPPPIPGRRLREIPPARPSTCQRTCPDFGTIPHFCGFTTFFQFFFARTRITFWGRRWPALNPDLNEEIKIRIKIKIKIKIRRGNPDTEMGPLFIRAWIGMVGPAGFEPATKRL